MAEHLERELDNLRARSTGGCIRTSRGRTPRDRRLRRFWRSHGHMAEARRLLALGLERDAEVAQAVQADALWAAARQAAAQSDWPAAEGLLTRALPLFRQDARGREVAFTLSELAFLAVRLNDLDRGADLCEESLAVARELGDARATSAALLTLAEIRSTQEHHAKALEHTQEAVALRRELGDPLLVTDAVHNLGWVAFLAADYGRPASLRQSLSGAREIGDALHTAEA